MKQFTIIENNSEVAVVCEALRCLRDIAQSCEEQKTLRYEIRKKCEVAANVIEANTNILKHAIDSEHVERARMLDDIERIFLMPSIDDRALRLAEMAFDYLKSTSAIAALNAAPKMPMLW